jgi:HEPN domain-containing protein
MSSPGNASSLWFRKAEEDLLGIRNNLNAQQIPWGLVGFLAQQTIEKYLKGLLAAHQPTIQRTHDLVGLLQLCCGFVPELQAYEARCRKVSALYLISRYPESRDVTESEAPDVVDTALEIRRVVLEGLKPS